VPSGGTVQVVPSQEGLVFDADKTAAALTTAADDPAPRNAEVAFTRTEPKLTTEEAKALGVKELVSTFTTRHPCCAPRVKNIHRIADIVDGAIVRPGATFSLNQYAGKRTTDRGFVLAPMIFDGEYKDDVGGGVSQFATTFYNAVFFGGYKAAYHKAHSYYISRYPPGREATVSWPHPDLKFVNDSPAGILIKTSYSSTSITVSFYGDKQGKTVTSETGERTNFTDPPTQRKANAAMAPGSERTVQRGSRGFDITVWRITKTADGDTRKEKFFTRYKPEPTIVEYGPGTPAPTSPEPSPDQPGSPEPPDTPRPPATPPGSTQGPSNP
jgi:vancomycin resistance protein YoaR